MMIGLAELGTSVIDRAASDGLEPRGPAGNGTLVGRLARSALRLTLRPAAARAERLLLNRAAPLRVPPIYLLGVPRSGTTLLYQLLAHCFRVAYFCNAAEAHSRYAALMTYWMRARIRVHETDFTSEYGRARGPEAPSEGLDIWRRFFPEGYVDDRYLDARAADTLRRIISAVSGILAAPFVNKDPNHCPRVRALDALFPGTLYVYVYRDPVATAASLLTIRRNRVARGEIELGTWTSVRPREYDRFRDLDVVGQISGQVHCAALNALNDLRAVAADRWIGIRYETLCADPRGTMSRIAAFLAERGAPLERRHPAPSSFSAALGGAVSPADRETIQREFVRRFGPAALESPEDIDAT